MDLIPAGIKIRIIVLVFVVFSAIAPLSLAATYYVDATNGNDANNGLSEATPWKTIAKVNALKFNPGDQILLKRGEFWREQLNVSSSGVPGNLITFGAYGSGNDPIINGSDELINWSLSDLKSAANLNIYQTQCNWIPTQVFEDGKHLDFIPWNTDLQNTSALMDTGKWTYDSSKMILYILCSDGNNPSIHSIEAQKRSYSLIGYDKNHIKIENLVFKMAKSDGLSNTRGLSWIISKCKAYSNYRYGIFMDGGNAKNCLIEECVVWDNNMGIGATNAIDLTIKGCTSHNNNYISDSDGMQFNYVTNLTVERCEIFENNYGGSSDGIQINHTQNATIRYNFLHNNGNSSIIFTGSQDSYGKVYYNTIIGGEKTV